MNAENLHRHLTPIWRRLVDLKIELDNVEVEMKEHGPERTAGDGWMAKVINRIVGDVHKVIQGIEAIDSSVPFGHW